MCIFIPLTGPMPHTIEDFWRMVHMTKAEIIVMTTMIVEEGKVNRLKFNRN